MREHDMVPLATDAEVSLTGILPPPDKLHKVLLALLQGHGTRADIKVLRAIVGPMCKTIEELKPDAFGGAREVFAPLIRALIDIQDRARQEQHRRDMAALREVMPA